MAEGEYTGGCMCGALRYRVSGAPVRVGICHCETCRRNTGAPFWAFAVFARERFAVLSGETGFFQSSPESKRHFCRACGSPIYSEWSDSDEVDVTLGSLDEPERMRPSYEFSPIPTAQQQPIPLRNPMVDPKPKFRVAIFCSACSAPGSFDTSLSHAAGLSEIAACHA